MNEKELISILENYAVFVDDDFGGSYQSIISYTKDKEISKAFTSLGALQIIDEFKQLQQKDEIINKAKEHLKLKVIRYSNETNYTLDETDLKEIIQILDNKGE